MISFIFIFPFAKNYQAIISASSKMQIDEYMSWFPYIKQLMTATLIVVYMVFCLNRRYVYNALVFFLPLVCLLLMLFLGGRKELLILVLFVVYSNLSRVSDGKMMLIALAVVILILSLGVFRAGVERAGGDNDFVNLFGEFIYSHSVLPFSISDAGLFKPNISSYWGVILFFIPSAVLPDKPIPPSYEISESLSYIFDGVGLGFNPLAEAYLTFGVWAPLGCLMALFPLRVGACSIIKVGILNRNSYHGLQRLFRTTSRLNTLNRHSTGSCPATYSPSFAERSLTAIPE